MVRSKNCGRGVHSPTLVEEGANIARKIAIIRSPGRLQRIGGLFICKTYLSPTEVAGGDERRQFGLPPCNSDSMFVGAAVSIRHLAAPFGS